MEVDPPSAEVVDLAFVPAGPKPIRRLDKDVINKIAAAEIIQRPANAIKELLENSLDAGSTSIKLSIKEGGLKLIQITDNGHGINRADLPLLCTRYATSKLREYKDLERMQTYGFRGEALASISYVSHVEVVTKTREDGCGWKAHYSNGELVEAKVGAGVDPKPAAANDGTIISAEDLFFNSPLRKRAFKSSAEEYNRILDVVTKYAIHNPHCAWICKKAGAPLPDISTPVSSTSRTNISLLYTPSLASELLEVPMATLKPEMLGAKCRGWVSNANSSWSRKGGWLLFINNRLVESSKIRKAIESMYTAYLPKGSTPWIYLSLEIDPSKVDVNVHPTKSEVHFLNEDDMIQAVVSAVHDVLKGANTSRSFTVQSLLPGAREPGSARTASGSGGRVGAGSASGKGDNGEAEGEDDRQARIERRKAAPNYKVRTDLTARTLDEMLAPAHPSQVGGWTRESQPGGSRRRPSTWAGAAGNDDGNGAGSEEGEGGNRRKGKRRASGEREEDALVLQDTDDDDAAEGEYGVVHDSNGGGTGYRGKTVEISESLCEFTSIADLRRSVRKRGNTEMTEILAKHAFVGVVDRHLGLSLVQHGTKLFLVNHASLADEHFYQLALRQFGTMDRLRLDPRPDLRLLLRLAAAEEDLMEHGLEIDEVVERIYEILMEKRDMMDEYFSLRLTAEGAVDSLPMVLRGYTPNLDRLPHFLLCLGTQVDWEDEKGCFETFLRELGFFYSPRPFLPAMFAGHHSEGKGAAAKEGGEDGTMVMDEAGGACPDDANQHHDAGGDAVGEDPTMRETKEEADHASWQIQHVLFPAFRRYTAWPAMGKEVTQVANLPDLFRIFERC